ncbi:conserved hypothetical protein [Sulfurospirillum deleyianum DSM 6946]|uniref:Uncharacterized protein n=2 Tax=Sulfurospirillum deleyianum TaxID=65553 RepID=D1B2Q4_SULD5|nr:conserved hypothetical protein [Sulfurospirillum deleyianum DSM 6946]
MAMHVVLIVEVEGLKNREVFEKHLKKEGFTPITGEEFAYEGDTSTHLFSTRAFVLEVTEKGLKKSGFDACKIMFQVGENPMEAYVYNLEKESYEEVKL